MGEAKRKRDLGIGRTISFCPATMCPLFAAGGSPWTGGKNVECPRRHASSQAGRGCGWYQGFGGCGCDGRTAALEQIEGMAAQGAVFQIGPVTVKRAAPTAPKSYDCPRAAECQWQIESGKTLCPPRLALAQGIDPRACAY